MLRDGDEEAYSLPEFSFITRSRSKKRGGGIGIYVHNDIQFKRRQDLDIFNEDIECMCIELISKSVSHIISVIYRPPNQSKIRFIDDMAVLLNRISTEKKQCILLGDFNINMLDYNTHSFVNNFIDMMATFSFYPQIVKPTRVTATSATVLDNIICNIPDSVIESGILTVDISDHLSPFAIIHANIPNDSSLQGSQKYKSRDYSDANIYLFCSKLEAINWSFLKSEKDVNKQFELFLHMFSKLHDECFPLIVKKTM